jgi:hypothetical protein
LTYSGVILDVISKDFIFYQVLAGEEKPKLSPRSHSYSALLKELQRKDSITKITQLAGYTGRNAQRDWETILRNGGYRGQTAF